MKINTAIIRGLNPCDSRFNNYLSHYKDFDGTLEEFLALDNITYSDKVWVFVKIANKSQLSRWSHLCAESVLHIFETKYPNDNRPRQALDATLKYINEPTDANLVNLIKHRNAAYATYATNDAAYAAGYAVAANAAAAANDANAAAAAAYAAYETAASNAAYAAAGKEYQQDLNLLFMIEAVS